MKRLALTLCLAGILAAVLTLLTAATLPASGPVHSNMGQTELLGHIADNTQRMVTGAGVATLPTAAPVHANIGQKELLAFIADNTQDAAAYGALINGDWKQNVRAATTANITIATALNNGDTLDGLTLATGDRVLVKDQSTASQNGIYVVAATPARATDSDVWAELPGSAVLVTAGTANANKLFINTSAATGTVGSTSITYTEFSSGGSVSDTVYGAGWNGDTTTAPSKNAVYDKIESIAGGGFDATTIDAPTWSDGANASNLWTFDVSGTDTTFTFGNNNWVWGVGSVDLGAAGVRLSQDGDGALTLLGLGNGSDEDLTINLDDTANTAVISSSTGLSTLGLGAIGITSTGTLTGGRMETGTDSATTGVLAFRHSGVGGFITELSIREQTDDRQIFLPDRSGDIPVLSTVSITDDNDGAITFLGTGAGADEDLTLNLDDTADTVVVSSSTGVTALDLGSIGLTTSGAVALNGSTTATTLTATTASVGGLAFEGATEDDFELTIAVTDPTADRTVTFPNATSFVPVIPQLITVTGPSAARTWTVPDANFTVARTDAANTFTGVQTMTAPVFVTKAQMPTAAGSSTLTTGGDLAINTTGKLIGIHNGTKEVAIPLIEHREFSFDPKAVCDGAVDRLFLFKVGAWAPNGITVTGWRVSFEADPTTEVDLDLKRADAFIGVANSAVMDVLDTTAGASSETSAANINGGAVVANGKVLYLEFGTAYSETTHQIIFEIEYEIEED